MTTGIAVSSIYQQLESKNTASDQKGLFEQNSTPVKNDMPNSPPHTNTGSDHTNPLAEKEEKEEKRGIFDVKEVGSLLKPKKQIEWEKVDINIPKKVMDVVEMNCAIRPDIRDHYDSLIHA